LTAAVWSQAIFKRPIPADRVVTAIVQDRQAALVCHGLTALDDETLAFFSTRPALLARIYERDAPAFAAFGESIRVHGGRVTPLDDVARPLWEAVVGERLDNPDRFLPALLELNEGRLAYLYDTIANLDPLHRAFALGTWVEDSEARASRFAALAATASRSYREWRVTALPFTRPLNDLATALVRIRLQPSGAPLAALAFWSKVFDTGDIGGETKRSTADRDLIDAAWLAEATAPGDMFARADRLDQFEFGQRRFSDLAESDWPDAIAAIRAFPRQRMLMLTLERIGVRKPAVYAAISRQAKAATGEDPNRAFWTLVQLQSSFALIARMVGSGTLSEAQSEQLTTSLFAVPLGEDGRYDGGIARWIDRQLVPALPSADDVEETLIVALSGPTASAGVPHVIWEGQRYRLDFAAAENRRLHLVRQKQGGLTLDRALEFARAVRTLRSEALSVENLQASRDRLNALLEDFPALKRSTALLVPGVQQPKPRRELIERAIDELSKAERSHDVKRAARLGPSLVEAADEVLAEVLLTVTYATDLGDPEGTALLASNVALRHDFGFELRDAETRMRRPWAIPRQDFLPGVPWHVTGALVGLDIALAPMALRRINPDAVGDAPRLPSNERDAFAVSAALVNARRLRDDDREAIVSAIDRGRGRIAALVAGSESFDGVANAIALDGWRRRELGWMLRNDPLRVPHMFSLVELMTLGGVQANADLDAWGASALYSSACVCTRMVLPDRWPLLVGRPQVALMSSIVPDLNLRIAIVLGELHLPAALARPVLAAAMQDFIDEASPTDSSDWLSLALAAQSVPRQRVEDYVAAAAAVDGPLVPETDGAAAAP
jgi:hypothetical protein